MPASDFSTHDPEFSPEQEEQSARIIDGLRKINARIVRLGGSLEALTAAADRVEALYESLGDVTQSRAIESYRFAFDPDDPNNVIPFNPATGEFNPIAPKLVMTLEGKKLVARCEFPNCYESAPDSVQGGMVAAVFDQLLAYSIMVEGVVGPTAWIKVNYLKPTPINQPLRFEAAVDSIDGKKYRVRGSCYLGDEKISDAEALVLGAYPLRMEVGGEA
jgi:acyl-coenzyme A thioesterase PaaI-like protein